MNPVITNPRALGELVRSRRLDCSMSISDLANAINRSRSYVSRIERGDAMSQQPELFNALSVALNVSADDLYTTAGLTPPDIVDALRQLDSDELNQLRAMLRAWERE